MEIAYKGRTKIFYIGDRLGNQTIISKSYIKKRNEKQNVSVLKIKCDCGDIREIRPSEITGKEKSCYKCNNRRRGRGYKEISGRFFSKLIYGAKVRNLKVEVDSKYLYEIFIKQNKKCALSGILLKAGTNSIKLNTASVDRIDSSKGYIKGNIQFVHKDINKMKLDFNQEYFIKMCTLIGKNQENGEN